MKPNRAERVAALVNQNRLTQDKSRTARVCFGCSGADRDTTEWVTPHLCSVECAEAVLTRELRRIGVVA